MRDEDLLKSFRQKVCDEIDIETEGINRHIIYTPFRFDDGDHYVITLRRDNGHYHLSDEGHTFMHLSYTDVDISQGQRGKFVEESLAGFGVENVDGELRLAVPDEAFGDALFSFVQALTKVTTVTDWTRERVKSTFWEDFQTLVQAHVPEDKLRFNYHDPELDPDGNYPIDCYIEAGKRPFFGYAINNDNRCRDATISIMHYERADLSFGSFAVFEDQTSITRRAVAQLSDVVGKQFSSLGARDRIGRFLEEDVLAGTN